jgi:hypothetical protein
MSVGELQKQLCFLLEDENRVAADSDSGGRPYFVEIVPSLDSTEAGKYPHISFFLPQPHPFLKLIHDFIISSIFPGTNEQINLSSPAPALDFNRKRKKHRQQREGKRETSCL